MRQEYKFLVPNDRMEFLRQAIHPHVVKDDHVEIGAALDYTVRSIYFDSSRMTEYHSKYSGDRNRKKYRIRGYNDYHQDNTVFLEIKRKHDLSIAKNRAPVAFRDVCSLLNTGDTTTYIRSRPDFPNSEQNAIRFLYNYNLKHLVPIVTVIYEREAYLYKFDHSGRVTFDKKLRGCIYPQMNELYDEINPRYVFRGHFILEIKSNYGFPEWAVPIIAELGVKRQALSKYTMCIDTNALGIRKYSNGEVIAFSHSPMFNGEFTTGPEELP